MEKPRNSLYKLRKSKKNNDLFDFLVSDVIFATFLLCYYFLDFSGRGWQDLQAAP